MARYCKQYTKTDCGPTAVLNALKWAGYDHTLKKGYKSLRRRCGWSAGEGTYSSDLVKVLKKYSKIKTTRLKKNANLKTLDMILKNQESFILLYTFKDIKGEDKGHFVFSWGKDSRHYLVYNDEIKKPNKRITRKLMNSYLRTKTRDGDSWRAVVIKISKK